MHAPASCKDQVRFPWSCSGTRPLWRITPPNFVLFHGMFPHSESYFRASGWFSSPAYSQSSKCTLSHLYKRAMDDYLRSQSHTEGVCSSLHYPCPRGLSGSGLSSTFAGLQKEAPEKLEWGGQKTGGVLCESACRISEGFRVRTSTRRQFETGNAAHGRFRR